MCNDRIGIFTWHTASVCAVGGRCGEDGDFLFAQNHNNTLWLNVNHIFLPAIQTRNAQTITEHFVNGFYFFLSLLTLTLFQPYLITLNSRDKIDILIHLSIGNTNWRHSSIRSKFISTDAQIDDDRKFTAAVVVVVVIFSVLIPSHTRNECQMFRILMKRKLFDDGEE